MEVAFQMQNSIRNILAIVGSVAVAWLVAMPSEAAAQARRTNNSEATWLSFDLETKLIMAHVSNPGMGPDVRRLRKDRPATFKFDVDGASGGEMIIMIDGEEAEFAEIPENAVVHLHWRPIENDPYAMFVTRIVYLSEEELAKRKEPAE